MRLSGKEISRASGNYTLVVRPQGRGGYWIAVVKINGESGSSLGHGFEKYVAARDEISPAIKEIITWMDRMGFRGKMWGASRAR